MQEEVEQRVVTLAINCAKLTEQELKKALVKLLQHSVVNARTFTMPETGAASGTILKVLSLLTALGCLGLLLARKRRP